MTISNNMIGIVDDEIDITDLFRDALCRISGVLVFTFNDSLKALEHFTVNMERYLLVLSDFRMPGLNGLELLRKVKTLNPYVRTILMSAFEVEGDPIFHKYLKDDVINTFFQKPITISHLYNEVNSQIHTYQLSHNRK